MTHLEGVSFSIVLYYYIIMHHILDMIITQCMQQNIFNWYKESIQKMKMNESKKYIKLSNLY